MNPDLIVRGLESCADWRDLTTGESDQRGNLVRAYLRLAVLDTVTLRQGISLYLSEHPLTAKDGMKARAKVFALLRVLFAVPDAFVSDGRGFGSWGTPVRNREFNLLWPFSSDSAGLLKLTGVSKTAYFGPPYDGLAEFDLLLNRFGRRTVQGAVGDSSQELPKPNATSTHPSGTK
jgi:hypothetical protein